MSESMRKLTSRLASAVGRIGEHGLYDQVDSSDHLKVFMAQHVFAVWDFICLLKELHRRLVSTSAPWFPPEDALSANLIGSILIEEESDLTRDGNYASHFEMYLEAMDNLGAPTDQIRCFLDQLRNNVSVKDALNQVDILPSTKSFVLTTFEFFDRPLHELAASFVFGREGITGRMFEPLLGQLNKQIAEGRTEYQSFAYYLKRHIDLDDHQHFPKALRMLENLIAGDQQKLFEAELAARCALEARMNFLSGIQKNIRENCSIAV